MPNHVKLFENWLDDLKGFFTGEVSAETKEQSIEDFKQEFKKEIEDISNLSEQPRMDPMKVDKYFVVHHTAGRGTAEGVVGVLNKRGLGVQWVIDRDGKVFRTLPDGVIGWHAGHRDQKDAPSDLQNHNSQGVEVIANNDADVLPVQVVAAFKLLKWLGYDKEDVWGHGEVTYNKASTEGKTIVDYWRNNFDKTPAEAEVDILGNDPNRETTPSEGEVSANPGYDKILEERYNFHKIPAGTNNWRSAQIPIGLKGDGDRLHTLLEYVIKRYGIKAVIRFNGDCDGDSNDCRHHRDDPATQISEEETLVEGLGARFFKLSSTRDQAKVNQLLDGDNVLIHCAHGADRTGGNVGGWLFSKGWGDTDKIWNYTTQYNSWNQMVKSNPEGFRKGGYLAQANKFGVQNLEAAKRLAQ